MSHSLPEEHPRPAPGESPPLDEAHLRAPSLQPELDLDPELDFDLEAEVHVDLEHEAEPEPEFHAPPEPVLEPERTRSSWLRFAALALGLILIGSGLRQAWSHREEVSAAVFDPLGLHLVEGHADRIHVAATESEVDPLLLGAIMFMESRGRGNQRSSADALGLMQLRMISVGDAAKRLDIETPGEEQVLADDDLNVRLGAAHLAWLLENSEGWPLERVLVSYNAGRVRLFRWEEQYGGWEGWRSEQERKITAGEDTNGSLEYARRALEVMERLRERGALSQAPPRPR